MHISTCIYVAQYTVILLNKLAMVKLHYAWLQEFLPHRKNLSLIIKIVTVNSISQRRYCPCLVSFLF